MRRSPGAVPAHRHRRLALAAVLGMALALLAATTSTAEVPEPPLVVDSDADDGQVRLAPATQTVTEDRVAWVLTNGGTDTLTFRLTVHAVETVGGGVEIGDPLDLPLALDTLTLGPSDAARIPLHLRADAPDAVALVAETIDAEPVTRVAGLALVGGGDRVQAQVGDTDVSRGVFTVRLDADGPALVDVAVRATAWPGVASADEVVEGVFVPAGGRDLDVALDGPLLGRLTVDVVVVGAGTARTAATVWWWPPVTVAIVIAVLLALAVVVVLLRRRRS